MDEKCAGGQVGVCPFLPEPVDGGCRDCSGHDGAADDIPPIVLPARWNGWDVVRRPVPQRAKVRAHLALRFALEALAARISLTPAALRAAFQMIEAHVPMMVFHPTPDLGDALDDLGFNLRVVGEPVSVDAQLE